MIGRVYKIIVNCSNDIYVGSTLQECRARWQDHKIHYNCWKNGTDKKKVSSFDLFEKHGIINCKIIQIKQYEVVDREHLRVYEQLWVNKLKPINKNNPFPIYDFFKKLITKMYRENNKEKQKEYSKKWRNDNQKCVKQKKKEYYQKIKANNPEWLKKQYQKLNKETRKKYIKKWYEENIEIVKRRAKLHYEKNKKTINEKRREKITCKICNCKVIAGNRIRHEKGKEHQRRLNPQPIILTPTKDQVICCGVVMRKDSLKKHQRTKKHQQLMEQQQNQ
jgi:hypothetical protein